MAQPKAFTKELEALATVLDALEPLAEDERKFVLRTTVDRLSISGVASTDEEPKSPGKNNRSEPAGSESLAGVTPRDFLRRKKPTSELQRMVCLAHYLTHARNKPEFKTSDLTALNTEAAGGSFSNASATIRNATSQSRFLAPAGNGGLKQITPLGEDFVRALPDQEAAKAAIGEYRSSRRRSAKRKKAVTGKG